ncbi:MAG: superoxide dismutase [Flavobacterium sp. BFFFF2]|nr:MAG: superoxide dismutase [Flavobacterium sp. BFFFF2]
MKGRLFFLLILSSTALISCKKNQLEEVVEVPLPTVEHKMVIGHPDDVHAESGPFQMVSLPYDYDALLPGIEPMTMDMHYSKHYLTYTNNLNRSLDSLQSAAEPDIEKLLSGLNMNDQNLRNNAGAYYNHSLFFESMAAKGNRAMSDTLSKAITRDFGSFDIFKNQFEDEASKVFGSGWVWLVTNRSGALSVTTTPNQDNPLMPGQAIKGTPILALDVWEHAYYLQYQYKRKKYIEAYFKLINWKKVSERYEEALQRK